MYCKNCGNLVKDGSNFCEFCGKPMEKATESSVVKPIEKVNNKKYNMLNSNNISSKSTEKAAKNPLKKSFFVFLTLFILLLISYSILFFTEPKSSYEVVLEEGLEIDLSDFDDWDKGEYSIHNIGDLDE